MSLSLQAQALESRKDLEILFTILANVNGMDNVKNSEKVYKIVFKLGYQKIRLLMQMKEGNWRHLFYLSSTKGRFRMQS